MFFMQTSTEPETEIAEPLDAPLSDPNSTVQPLLQESELFEYLQVLFPLKKRKELKLERSCTNEDARGEIERLRWESPPTATGFNNCTVSHLSQGD